MHLVPLEPHPNPIRPPHQFENVRPILHFEQRHRLGPVHLPPAGNPHPKLPNPRPNLIGLGSGHYGVNALSAHG
jgi:hypothetical protein